MNVLSLFDGISGAQVALNRAGVPYNNYFASEIDDKAITVTNKHFPKTAQLGSVLNWGAWAIPRIDLLVAGFCCQSFSMAGKQKNFTDDRGKLFFEAVDILRASKARHFLFENVQMKKEFADRISEELGVEPIAINSRDFSALNRPRLYWTNIPVADFSDRGIYLDSILQAQVDSKYYLSNLAIARLETIEARARARGLGYKKSIIEDPSRSKFLCLDANYHKGPDGKRSVIRDSKGLRMATPLECERLQTLPDNYTAGLSDTARYRALGNGFTIEVVSHIMKGMLKCS